MSVNNENSLKSKFDHLFTIISGDRFLKMQGLGNEVPFFICPFSPKDMSQMNDIQTQLASKLRVEGVKVLTINLYDLSEFLNDYTGTKTNVVEYVVKKVYF